MPNSMQMDSSGEEEVPVLERLFDGALGEAERRLFAVRMTQIRPEYVHHGEVHNNGARWASTTCSRTAAWRRSE